MSTTMIIAERFELLRLAGQGGMATVHHARDRKTDHDVAVKIVGGPFANARFEREAELLSTLTHPNIVGYVAHGRIDEGRMFLAMEWLEGEPLDARLDRGPLDLEPALTIVSTIARALESAHARGVVHRDVKPSNVILRGSSDADPVLVDFGIVCIGPSKMTMTGAVMGTPAYMAPEQVRGEKEIDARADLFSLGCLLFECMTGQLPFDGEHTVAILAKILLEKAPRLRSIAPEAPEMLERLLDDMLAKAKEDRPASCARVADALDAIRSGQTPSLVPRAPTSSRSIGVAEQRFATVVLVRPKDVTKSLELADTVLGTTAEDELTKAALELGIRLHPLANGGYAGMLAAEHRVGDAAMRMVRCALSLHERMQDSAIAIASGRALVGGDLPMGGAIDRAAELLSQASAEQGLWLCDGTSALVQDRFELAPRANGAIVVRERAPEEAERTLLGRSTPCVGRDRELALLEATFRECADEPIARAVLIVAEPGIGKSRLQRELTTRLHGAAEQWTVLGDPMTATAPYAIIGALLRKVFRLGDRESIEARRSRIVTSMTAMGVDPKVAPWLGEIAGTPFDDTRDDALRAARGEPSLLAAQVTTAFTTWVRGVLTERPLLLIVEDIHWADVASVRLLGSLLGAAQDLPLMLVALARPSVDDAFPKLWVEHRCERIRLDPLLKKAASQLARLVLGPEADVEALVQRAGGNALFVEELARALAEGRTTSDLPPTIAAVTEARLASFPAEVRKTLRAASIFGERFFANGAEALAGEDVSKHLAFLAEREIVSAKSDGQWVFRHALVRDAAYAMLTDQDRELGHALAAAWLEEERNSNSDDGALLGRHWEAGGKPLDAARCYARAAEQAVAANDFEGTFRYAEHAASLGADDVTLGPAHLAVADAWLWIGKNDRAAAASLQAAHALPRASEKWFTAVGIGVAASGKGGDDANLFSLTTLLENTPAADARSRRARAIACARAAIQIAYFADIPRADALIEMCRLESSTPDLAEDKAVTGWLIQARLDRGHAAGEPEHPSVALQGRELFLEVGDRRAAYGVWASEIQLYASIGSPEHALRCCEALVAHVGEGAPSTIYAKVMLGFQQALVDAVRGEFSKLDTMIAGNDPASNPRFATVIRSNCATLLFAAGLFDRAKDVAEKAIAIANGPACYKSASYAVLARLASRSGDVSAAIAFAAQAHESARVIVPINTVPFLTLAQVEAVEARGGDARSILREALVDMDRRTRHLGAWRDELYASYGMPEVFAAARARGVEC